MASDTDSVIMEGIFVLEVDAFVLMVNNDSRVTRRLIVGALDLELDMRWELLIACAETLDIHGVNHPVRRENEMYSVIDKIIILLGNWVQLPGYEVYDVYGLIWILIGKY